MKLSRNRRILALWWTLNIALCVAALLFSVR
jgi:hypothetical protein